MSRTKSTIPQELREYGIAAVHQRPFCANEDSHIVGRFDAEDGLGHLPQARACSRHTAYAAIILDIDSTEGLDDAPGKSWWGGNPTPAPNWMVVNTRPATPQRRAGGIHAVFSIETPVARHDAAHMLPLRYLAHVADRLSYHLGADPGYQGFITRNPINPGPGVLRALGADAPLHPARAGHRSYRRASRRRTAGLTGIGRNC